MVRWKKTGKSEEKFEEDLSNRLPEELHFSLKIPISTSKPKLPRSSLLHLSPKFSFRIQASPQMERKGDHHTNKVESRGEDDKFPPESTYLIFSHFPNGKDMIVNQPPLPSSSCLSFHQSIHERIHQSAQTLSIPERDRSRLLGYGKT